MILGYKVSLRPTWLTYETLFKIIKHQITGVQFNDKALVWQGDGSGFHSQSPSYGTSEEPISSFETICSSGKGGDVTLSANEVVVPQQDER